MATATVPEESLADTAPQSFRLPSLPTGWAIVIGSLMIAAALWLRPGPRYAMTDNAETRLDTRTGELAWCLPEDAGGGKVRRTCRTEITPP